MKKTVRLLILCLAVCLLCAGCSAGETEPSAPSATEPPFIDLDLAGLSGTVVYAQVYNLVCEYEKWLGKTIRIAGYYNYYNDEANSVVYHACIIPDATACCAQGIEFVWYGEHPWPDAYPEIGTNLTVTGRLETYDDNGTQYLHLVDADVVFEETPEELK